ncbi:MAG: tetratricopeptide repeat protein [Gammaproteobacteria bacterium]|nr:tetratricopeptide repeat protein [Gammaproteobacteria bacterium]MDH3411498.1 tetratricopeptide repeat protein [Gammaproteobacteria bacterium]
MLRSTALAVLILAHLSFFAPSVRADQTDARLDALFVKLQNTTDPVEGARITRQIRIIWRQTENETANNAMANAGWKLYNKQYHEAIDLLNRALTAEPDYAEAWSRRAAVFYLLGEYPSALEDIKSTLALEPRHFGALAELGAIHMQLKNFEVAKSALLKALEINPHLAGTRQNLKTVESRLVGEPA